MESTLKNMVVVLFLITLVASGAVAVVNQLTAEPIAQAKAAKTSLAIGQVVPEFDNDIAKTADTIAIDGGTAIIYTAEKGGKPVGYAVKTFTNNGFSGLFTLMVGFLPDGTIRGLEVLTHAETPGLGSKMTDSGNPLILSFEGKSPADLKMAVKKDGGDIDAITASTITSRAYVDAVERAFRVFQAEVQGAELVQKVVEVNPYEMMFPGYDNDPASEKASYQYDTNPADVFTVRKGSELMGYMVFVAVNGYNPDVPVEMLVGFAPDSSILGIWITSHRETPGYGAEMTNADSPLLLGFKGKKAGDLNMTLSVDGGDIEAISGATITSEAYVRGVREAYNVFQQVVK